MALEPIQITHPTDRDRADVEQRVVRAAERNPEPFLAAYRDHPESFGGRYVCADLMKETIPEYAASPVARGRYNNAVHNTAAVLASEQFDRAVRDGSDPLRRSAGFITGTPGSGKTSLVLATGLQPDMRVIYEGQLIDGSSRAKIASALTQGLPVTVAAVLPRIEDALENTLSRFERVGRGASIATMTRIHENTPAGLEAIQAAFGDQVEIEVHDVRDRQNPRSYDLKDGLQLWREELGRGSTEQRLYDQLNRIRAEGRGSDDFDRQARGRPIEARDARVASQPDRGNGQAREEPRRAGADRGAGLLGTQAADAPFDGAERIVAMNGSRLHEKRFDGEWSVMKGDGQGMLPTGIYRLDGAQRADPTAATEYHGQIIHADRQRVFQLGKNGVVEHEAHRFNQAPAIGEAARISYQQGRASLANRPAAPALAASADPAKPENFGAYLGPITKVEGGAVTQLVGGKPFVHQLRYLTGKTGELSPGKTVAIDYTAGIGKVTNPQQQTQGRSR